MPRHRHGGRSHRGGRHSGIGLCASRRQAHRLLHVREHRRAGGGCTMTEAQRGVIPSGFLSSASWRFAQTTRNSAASTAQSSRELVPTWAIQERNLEPRIQGTDTRSFEGCLDVCTRELVDASCDGHPALVQASPVTARPTRSSTLPQPYLDLPVETLQAPSTRQERAEHIPAEPASNWTRSQYDGRGQAYILDTTRGATRSFAADRDSSRGGTGRVRCMKQHIPAHRSALRLTPCLSCVDRK